MFYKIITQILFIIQWIRTIFKNTKPLPPKPVEKTYEEIYNQTIQLYKNMSHEDANVNIIKDLYDIKQRKLLLDELNNDVEKKWTSRYLMEYTKNSGNIIMYYDCFKMAFAYYSDAQTISNKDLYYAAMKYVVRFRCRDFLIDMDNFPDNKMIDLLREEDKQMKTKTKQVNNPLTKLNSTIKTSATIKAATAKPATTKPMTTKPATMKPAMLPPNLFSTKFVRIGKLCEFNILKIPKNKNIEIVNTLLFSDKQITTTNNFFDGLDITTDEISSFAPDNKKNSYAEWKKQQLKV